jgi:hypothetical protein
MIPITPNLDPKRLIESGPTSFMTEQNEHEVRCGMCAREFYVDDKTYDAGNLAIESGLDSPFRCEVCAEDYDDLAYEG